MASIWLLHYCLPDLGLPELRIGMSLNAGNLRIHTLRMSDSLEFFYIDPMSSHGWLVQPTTLEWVVAVSYGSLKHYIGLRFPSKPTVTFPHIKATMHFRTILATAVLLCASNVLGTPAPQAETICESKYSSSEPMGTQELFIILNSPLIGTSDYVSTFFSQWLPFINRDTVFQQCTVIG